MKKKYLILILIFFLFILFLSPISGDDWGNYLVGLKGIKHMIGQAIGMYFSWEGRIISRLLINILTVNKYLFNIINSLLITSSIYFIYKIINPKDNKNIFIILSILSILLMNIFTFSQTITWVAGSITYFFPLALLLIYIYYIKEDLNKYNIPILIINLIIPMFVEHMGVILVILNLYLIISKYINNKKLDKKYLLFTIISLISISIMLLSPGSHLRALQANVSFNSLNIFDKLIYNIPNLIYYTYIVNSFMLLLLVIVLIYLIKKTINKKIIRYLSYLFVSIYPVITIIIYNLNIIHINIFNNIINQNNIFVIIYFIIITIIYLILLIKNKYYFQFKLSILGYLANIVMLISPTWGFRTSLATYMLITISLLTIIKDIKINKIINYIIKFIIITTIIIYIILYINLFYLNNKREKLIKENINNDYIEVIKLPNYGPCNINPKDDYHIKVFKSYYNIKENTTIIVK